MLRQIDRTEAWARWPVLGPALVPAMLYSSDRSPNDVLERLMNGSATMLEVSDFGAEGLIVIDIVEDDDETLACWVSYIVGVIDMLPRRKLEYLRWMMSGIETVARRAGCRFMRIGGRDYRRIFPDYAPFDPEAPNRLQKVLLDG